MIHLTPQQLSSYMDGELNEASTELVRRHMGACEECTLKFAALEEQEELLARAIVHDPGDEFFESFTAEVERHLLGAKESGGKSGASSATARARAARTAPTPPPAPAEEVAPPKPSKTRGTVTTSDPIAGWEPLASRESDDLDGDDSETSLNADVVNEHYSARRDAAPAHDSARRDPAPTHDSARRDAGTSHDSAPKAPPSPRPVPPARAERSGTPAIRPKPPARPVPRRPKIRRPAPSIPWYAAMILALISSAAAVVASRTEPVSAWLDSHVLQPAATQVDPGQTIDTPPVPSEAPPPAAGGVEESGLEDELDGESGISAPDTEEPKPQEASRFLKSDPPAAGGTRESSAQRDPLAPLPPDIQARVRAAQRIGQTADADPTAARYEAAASEWERVIPLLAGKPQQTIGWFELASSRFRAWEMDPTPGRAASATTAIRAYLATAPQGPARDQARAWMARVSR